MPINQSLASLIVPLNTLHEDPRNARRHPPRNLESIKASLRDLGQQKPIVVLPDGTIVAGNGTFRAAVALGWEGIAAVKFEGTARQARLFAIADNRTAELAEWDVGILQSEMHDLGEESWDSAGWTVDELRETAGELPSAGLPTGEARHPASAAETGRTPTDKLDTFLNNALRQIVLIYPAEQHAQAVKDLEMVQADQGLSSNTDAVAWLLEQYKNARDDGK